MMFFKGLLRSSIFQGFVFKKVVPGILIGLLATKLDPSMGGDMFSFALCMVVFWAAIGLGHGIAELATRSQS